MSQAILNGEYPLKQMTLMNWMFRRFLRYYMALDGREVEPYHKLSRGRPLTSFQRRCLTVMAFAITYEVDLDDYVQWTRERSGLQHMSISVLCGRARFIEYLSARSDREPDPLSVGALRQAQLEMERDGLNVDISAISYGVKWVRDKLAYPTLMGEPTNQKQVIMWLIRHPDFLGASG